MTKCQFAIGLGYKADSEPTCMVIRETGNHIFFLKGTRPGQDPDQFLGRKRYFVEIRGKTSEGSSSSPFSFIFPRLYGITRSQSRSLRATRAVVESGLRLLEAFYHISHQRTKPHPRFFRPDHNLHSFLNGLLVSCCRSNSSSF